MDPSILKSKPDDTAAKPKEELPELNSQSNTDLRLEEINPIQLESEEKKPLTTQDILKWFRFYLMPVLIFVFFITVILFFIVPQIGQISTNLETIDDLSDEYNKKGETIKNLSTLSLTQERDRQVIEQIESLVPTNSTKVVEFRDRLEDIATESGLQIEVLNAGEVILNEVDNPFLSASDLPLYLIEIPSELTASAPLENFKEFLSNLYDSSDFFVVSEMSINKSGLSNEWKAEFIIVKYQFGGSVQLPEDLADFIERKPLDSVVDFVERKYGTGSGTSTLNP